MKKRHSMLQRSLALVLILVLGITLLPMGDTSAKKKTTTATVKMKEKKVMVYSDQMPDGVEDHLFFNGSSDIPYIDLEETRLGIQSVFSANSGVSVSVTSVKKTNTLTWIRTSGVLQFKVVFNFKKNTIRFDDLNGFFRREGQSLVGSETIPTELLPLFEAGSNMYNRYGKVITIDLNKYGVKLLKDKKRYYIPLQTYNDVFGAKAGGYLLYNGECVISNSSSDLSGEMQDIYYKAPKKKMSKAYAAFNYGELCLMLDYLYGLKDTHDIKTFDQFFTETGLGAFIKNRDTMGTDVALTEAINLYFDDLHCGFGCCSYGTDPDAYKNMSDTIPFGAFRSRVINNIEKLQKYRAAAAPEGIKAYEEIGDTAYITFDGFEVRFPLEYSSVPTDEDLPNLGEDTIRLMQYSLAKITRDGSPIKKVVLDLSLNGGGYIFAACYLLCTFLGTSSLAMKDTYTGASSMIDYKADVNLDGKFDAKDTLANRGLKLYCLISGTSYSCANLVPAVFKDTGAVTLIGRTSGGGTSAVQPCCTASGATLQLSSSMRFSFSKNGGFYDCDRGADPDVFVDDMSKIYDRKYMNEFLDGVK